jgi:hypothetical protein
VRLERALDNEAARRVLKTLLERQYSDQVRKKPPLLKLDAKRMPEFGPNRKFGQADEAWEAIRALSDAGFITIDRIRTHPDKADYECSPTVRLVQARAAHACEVLGISFDADPWTAAWQRGCRSAPWLAGEHAELLAARRHRIGERSAEDMLARWQRIATERFESLGLREVSAEVFWGLSKELDERGELVARLRAAHGLPALTELPLLVPILLMSGWRERGVLFVENVACYAACVRGRVPAAHGHAIVYASGYRMAARRLRQPDMTLVSFDPTGERSEEASFLAWLHKGEGSVRSFFWGDLDYAGMCILRELNAIFRGIQAWRPGYEPMLAAIERGDGHLPDEAEKRGQDRPGVVGCHYADTVLGPALQRTGLFYDQEGVLAKRMA